MNHCSLVPRLLSRAEMVLRMTLVLPFVSVLACAPEPEVPLESTPSLSGHSDRGGIGIESQAEAVTAPLLALDLRRSFAVTDSAILSAFTLSAVLGQIGAPTAQTADPLFRQLWDTQNPAPGLAGLPGPHCSDNGGLLNGFSYPCRPAEGAQASPASSTNLASYSAVGLFNRFDLAPSSGADCGEHRIVFAKTGGGAGRAFIIFEAVLPNPRPNKGIEGCRPVVDFWASLSEDNDQSSRAGKLQSFYFNGLPGFSPVVAADNYGIRGGQVRLNMFITPPWFLRELKSTRDCALGPCRVVWAPVTVKTNPFGGLFGSATSDRRAQEFQQSFFPSQVASLASGDVNTFNYTVPDSFNAGGSDAQSFGLDDYGQQLAGNPAFRTAIAAELSRIGSSLSPESIVARAQALSCGGCHQRSVGADLGGGISFPLSAGFVHASEFVETGPDGARFRLSSALTDTFLPFRASVASAFIQRDADTDGVLDARDNCLGLANTSQIDSDGDGYGNLCDGDLNNDEMVNALDLGILRTNFGTTSSTGDMNGDGRVNALDLGLFRGRFGAPPGPSALR